MTNALGHMTARAASLALGTALAVLSPGIYAGQLSDAQIMGIYIQVNGFDIDTALLGRSQGGSPALRQFAEHVAADHIGVRQSVYEIAAKCKTAPTLPLERYTDGAEHDKALAKLLALTGAAFDKAYLEHEIAFHRAAIEAVRTQLLPVAKCPELQTHFKAVLPAFEHHLTQTEALAATAQPAK